MNRLSRKKTRFAVYGFTLIELLVVISIIALLIAILMPALNKAREEGKKAVCLQHQHQIMIGAAAYSLDNNDKFMYQNAGTGGGIDWTQPRALADGSRPNWISRVWSYLGDNRDIFNCPANKWRHEGNAAAYDTWYPQEDEGDLVIAYVANGLITHFGGRGLHPSRTVAISDDFDISNGAILRPHFVGSNPSLSEARWVGWMRYSSGNLLTIWPHSGGRVHGYLDAHAEWNRSEEISSRNYGLLMFENGEWVDGLEPEMPGYDSQERWGLPIIR